MKAYFATKFEDFRHERSLFLSLSLTDRDLLKQSKFTDHEMNTVKKFAPEILRRQNNKKIRWNTITRIVISV